MDALFLAHRRLPLRAPRKLPAALKAQLAWILEREGAGSMTAASKDEEWRDSLEVVDVRSEASGTEMQLWAWPSGSAVVFRDGTTEVLAEAAQHALAVEDAGLRERLRGALEGAAAAGLAERLQIAAPSARGRPGAKAGEDAREPPDDGAGTPAGGVAARIAALAAIPVQDPQRYGRNKTFVQELFGKPWHPYPKRHPDELTADQRALLEALGDWCADLQHHGLFHRPEWMRRFLGRAPAGPADIRIERDGGSEPLWRAVTHVGSGDANPQGVLDAFRALPAAEALAAWRELANGDAYDIAIVHPRTMAEAGIPRTPGNVKHRTRLFGWLADASVALGDAGRRAAEDLVRDLPSLEWGHRLFVGLASLARHAKARREVLDPAYDPLLAKLRGPGACVWAEPLWKEILKGLPKERAAALAEPAEPVKR